MWVGSSQAAVAALCEHEFDNRLDGCWCLGMIFVRRVICSEESFLLVEQLNA